jgi:hypothetical protein
LATSRVRGASHKVLKQIISTFLKHCTLASNVKAADFVSLAVSFFARWSMQQRPPSFGKRGQRGDLTTTTAQSAAGSAMVRELCRNFETSH